MREKATRRMMMTQKRRRKGRNHLRKSSSNPTSPKTKVNLKQMNLKKIE